MPVVTIADHYAVSGFYRVPTLPKKFNYST